MNINQEDLPADHKRGSAITFFDESDGENDRRKKDEMQMTLDGFRRPSKKDWSQDK